MFKIIGEYLILRRIFLINLKKKRLGKMLFDVIWFFIVVIWMEFCFWLKMFILFIFFDKSILLKLSLNCFKLVLMKKMKNIFIEI